MHADEDLQRLMRNLTLSIQTVTCCGHAMRVAVADMLKDFEDIRRTSDANEDVRNLCRGLERAIRDDILQNRQVFELLGFDIQ